MKIQKIFMSILAAAVMLSTAACGGNSSAAVSEYPQTDASSEMSAVSTASYTDAEVIIFADSELDGAVEAMKDSYEKSHPGVRIIRNFDDPSTLANELTNKARADIFLTADSYWLDRLDASKGTDANPHQNNLIDGSTRVTLLDKYYAGKLINAFYPDAASDFLTWLGSDEALQILSQAEALHPSTDSTEASPASEAVR